MTKVWNSRNILSNANHVRWNYIQQRN